MSDAPLVILRVYFALPVYSELSPVLLGILLRDGGDIGLGFGGCWRLLEAGAFWNLYGFDTSQNTNVPLIDCNGLLKDGVAFTSAQFLSNDDKPI